MKDKKRFYQYYRDELNQDLLMYNVSYEEENIDENKNLVISKSEEQ